MCFLFTQQKYNVHGSKMEVRGSYVYKETDYLTTRAFQKIRAKHKVVGPALPTFRNSHPLPSLPFLKLKRWSFGSDSSSFFLFSNEHYCIPLMIKHIRYLHALVLPARSRSFEKKQAFHSIPFGFLYLTSNRHSFGPFDQKDQSNQENDLYKDLHHLLGNNAA